MDEDTLHSHINILKEMILDEQKLVTYVSLSKDLCIHVNDSKSLLVKIVKDIRKKVPDTDLNISYIVSGLCGDRKARTTVCSESDLATLKESFQNIFFEHIYSVCKGSPSLDSSAFIAVNKFEDYPLCSGLIKSEYCIKQSQDQIRDLKNLSQVSLGNDKTSNLAQKKAKIEPKKVDQNGHNSATNVEKVKETKSEPVVKTEIISPKKDKTNNIKQQVNTKNNSKAQKGIAGFFTKSNSAPPTKVKDIMEIKQEPIAKIQKVTELTNDTEMDVDDVKPETKVIKQEKKKENGIKEKSNAKSLKNIKKNAKVDKKRKRVLHVSDSESDDEKNDPFIEEPVENNEVLSEDEIPPTPATNTIKITSGIMNPRKRRKIVDKTYTDEDGYILTKKEEVYESCSDNEGDTAMKCSEPETKVLQQSNHPKIEVSPKEKKSAPKNSKKKISPPQNGKQKTLMNFFKKI